MTAAEAAKRCSCANCRPKLERAIQQAIREAGEPLAAALSDVHESFGLKSPDSTFTALKAWEEAHGKG